MRVPVQLRLGGARLFLAYPLEVRNYLYVYIETIYTYARRLSEQFRLQTTDAGAPRSSVERLRRNEGHPEVARGLSLHANRMLDAIERARWLFG